MMLYNLEKRLSLEYIDKYIRRKGLATFRNGKSDLSFKLYDSDWHLRFEQGCLSISVEFELGDDFDMACLLQATNKVNEERYIVKAAMREFVPHDGEGKPMLDAEVQRSIAFSFENLCLTESAFKQAYEFCVYALTDAMDSHRKYYVQYLEKSKAKARDVRIGFDKEGEKGNDTDATVTKNNHRKIGFIQ